MTGETPTGPSIPTGTPAFGRWQQPAAHTEAGLVPADPYPLEKILFCATCGQQFIGTDEPGGTRVAADGAPIAGGTDEPGDAHESGEAHLSGTGTHEAGGGARVPDGTHVTGDTHLACGTDKPGDGRVYRTFCDHRPGPIPASEVELRVYAETHVLAFGTDAVAGLSNADYALLAVRFFTRVELGSTSDEMTFSTRI